MRNLTKKNLIPLATVILLTISSCTDQTVKPRFLIGEWKIISILGEEVDYPLSWEFFEGGNFQQCDDGDCESGSWLWAKEKGLVTIHLNQVCGTIDIVVLNQTQLEGAFTAGGEISPIEMTRR